MGFSSIEFPEGNEYSNERWLLGKKLFYDSIMSRDYSVSCGSCHKQEFAFGDHMDFSRGTEGRSGTRNTPSIVNIAYHPYFTREGGVPTLEMHALVPIQEHDEFDFNILHIADRISNDDQYVTLSLEAYDRQPDPFVITRALACFQRSLISGNSSYDQYLYNGEELSERAKFGEELFFSERTQCSACHDGFNFTDYSFQNTGLYEEYLDNGRFRLTGKEEDLAKFKVPSLRNIELTAPYMHDGSLETLDEVLEHYNSGGHDHPNKSTLIQPLALNTHEIDALKAFLKSLTDHSFINNDFFLPD